MPAFIGCCSAPRFRSPVGLLGDIARNCCHFESIEAATGLQAPRIARTLRGHLRVTSTCRTRDVQAACQKVHLLKKLCQGYKAGGSPASTFVEHDQISAASRLVTGALLLRTAVGVALELQPRAIRPEVLLPVAGTCRSDWPTK
eukprot:365998-Chlamydomonas_euryale.AAC.1